jgi:hypothetical protein
MWTMYTAPNYNIHATSIIQKSPIGWRVDDVSDGHLAVSHDL